MRSDADLSTSMMKRKINFPSESPPLNSPHHLAGSPSPKVASSPIRSAFPTSRPVKVTSHKLQYTPIGQKQQNGEQSPIIKDSSLVLPDINASSSPMAKNKILSIKDSFSPKHPSNKSSVTDRSPIIGAPPT